MKAGSSYFISLFHILLVSLMSLIVSGILAFHVSSSPTGKLPESRNVA
jgi:hypothetical protein